MSTARRTAAPTRAAVYVRLSDYREDDASLSPQSQEDTARAYAAAHGWEVVAVEADLDYSGTAKGLRLDRPGLARLLGRLSDFDVIIARDLSRYARSVVDFATLAERCEAEGVALVSVKEGLDLSAPTGRFVATILAAFAEMEAAATGERVAAHRAAAARAGRYAGGRPPFGYRREDAGEGVGSILVPDAREARVLALAVEGLLSERLSLYRVTERLNACEDTRPRSGLWSTTRLKRALLNPAVRGIAIHKGEPVRGDDGMPFAPFEAVLSADDHERVRALLDRPEGAPQRRERSALLSGLAVCALCGGNLHRAVMTQPAKDRRYDVYRCGGRSVGRDCRGLSIKAEHVEVAVEAEYLRRFGHFAEVRVEERQRDAAGLAEVEAALRDVTEAMRAPGADIVTLARQAATLAERRDALAGEVETVAEAVETGRTMAEAWAAADLGGRQAYLGDALVRVEVAPGVRGRRTFDPERLRVVWRGEEG